MSGNNIFVVMHIDLADYTSLCENLDTEEILEIMDIFYSTAEECVEKHGGIPVRREGDKLVSVFGFKEFSEFEPINAILSAEDFLSKIKIKKPNLSFHIGIAEGTGNIEDDDGRLYLTGEVDRLAGEYEAISGKDEIVVSPHIAYEFNEHITFLQKGKGFLFAGFKQFKGEGEDKLNRIIVKGMKSSGKTKYLKRALSSDVFRNPLVCFTVPEKVPDGFDSIILNLYNLTSEKIKRIKNLPDTLPVAIELSYLNRKLDGFKVVEISDIEYTLGDELDFLFKEFPNRTGMSGEVIGLRLFRKFLERFNPTKLREIMKLSIFPGEIPEHFNSSVIDDLLRNGIIMRGYRGYTFAHEEVKEYLRMRFSPEDEEREMLSIALFLEETGSTGEDLVKLYVELGRIERAMSILSKLAKDYIESGKLEKAGELIKKGEEIASGETSGFLTVLRVKKDYLESLKNYTELIEVLMKIIRITDSAPEKEKCLIELAETYVRLGNFREAGAIFEKNPGLLLSPRYGVEANITMARISEGMFHYQDAIDRLKKVLSQIPGREKQRKIQVLEMLGEIYRRNGNLDEAESVFNLAIKLADEMTKHRLMLHLGNIQFYRSKFEEALATYKTLLESDVIKNSKMLMATVLSNIGGVYHSFGKYHMAIDYFKRAMEIDKETGNTKGMGVRLNNIGSAYAEVGMFSEAEKYFRDALKIDKALGNREGELTKLGNLSSVLYHQGKKVEAMRILNEVIEELKKQKNHLGIAYYSVQMADYMVEENPDEALKLLRESEKHCLRYKLYGYLVPCYAILAYALKQKGNLRKAKKYVNMAEEYLSRTDNIEWNSVEVYFLFYKTTGDVEYLRMAYDNLVKTGEELDEGMKRVYYNVKLNREVLEEWRRIKQN